MKYSIIVALLLVGCAKQSVTTSMTVEDQCQIWNKWAVWPQYGTCPNDKQLRVYN